MIMRTIIHELMLASVLSLLFNNYWELRPIGKRTKNDFLEVEKSRGRCIYFLCEKHPPKLSSSCVYLMTTVHVYDFGTVTTQARA